MEPHFSTPRYPQEHQGSGHRECAPAKSGRETRSRVNDVGNPNACPEEDGGDFGLLGSTGVNLGRG